MAVTEVSTLIRYKDASGNTNILLPITNVEGVDGLEEALLGKANATHTHAIADVTNLQTQLDGNAGTATKLATARTISLGTGATGTATSFDGSANITIPVTSVKEAYLEWGGKDFAGNCSPVDAAINSEFNGNRLAFMQASDIVVEYSTDAGSTWTDYGLTDTQKQSLTTLSQSISIGKKASSITTSDQVRVTLTATSGKLYFRCRKFMVYLTTNGAGSCKCKVEVAKNGSDTTYTTLKTVDVSGWSGWNVIQISNPFGGSDSQTSQYRRIRLTFSIGSVSSSYSSALTIYKIRAYGETLWTSPSTLADTGHMYTFDVSKNVTFPAKVTASSFSGSLTGNADTATKLATARTVSLTGDATGSTSFDGSANASITATLASSGVTAGSYGPSANATPAHAGTFSVPYITVDAKGRVTAASTKTITLPADNNTDTKVTNTLATTTKAYVTGTTSATTNTGTQVFDTGVYLDTTAGRLVSTSLTTGGTTIALGSSANIIGTTKQPTTVSNQLVLQQGAVFSGTAAAAGLVTRGICGVTQPSSTGACSKDNLYINYDGENTFNSGRQVVLQAGTAGTHYGNNLYQYAAARGDIVKAWVENTANAASAAKLATARTLSLTGDATGSASFDGSANASIAATLASSGVTAGSYGPSANASPAHSGTFSVPYITVDTKGRVTSASTKTITLPADNNTDTKVTQTVTTTNASYPILLAPSGQTATATTTAYFDSGVTLNPSTNTIAANISGSAATLTTARTFRTNLASTSTASFNGSANVTPGVTGTLPLGNGGTGSTTADGARTNLGAAKIYRSETEPTSWTVNDIWFQLV